jgi:hypothetical protein
MAERPDAYIVHKTPSRLRLKIPARRRDETFFANAAKSLERIPGVKTEVNPYTSSILLQGARVAEALSALGEDAPFRIKGAPQEKGLQLEQLRQQLQTFSDEFAQLTGGGDARAFVVLSLVISGIVQLARGNIGPPALTLLWYAGEALRFWPSNPLQKAATPR